LDLSLSFEINEPKRVVVKLCRNASYVARKNVKLINARGAKAKEPEYQLKLLALQDRCVPRQAPEA
jgi:hypothetical protein